MYYLGVYKESLHKVALKRLAAVLSQIHNMYMYYIKKFNLHFLSYILDNE